MIRYIVGEMQKKLNDGNYCDSPVIMDLFKEINGAYKIL